MKSTQFGPAMHEVWRRALTETVHVQLGKGPEARKKGVALRHRLYQLRRALEAEGNELGKAADRVSLHLRNVGETNWVLIASIADESFEQLLSANGITVPEAPDLDKTILGEKE